MHKSVFDAKGDQHTKEETKRMGHRDGGKVKGKRNGKLKLN